MKARTIFGGLVTILFAIQSLAVSFAMITKQLTVPFLIPIVTVAAGWVTLILMIVAIIATLFKIVKVF